jgi:nitrile hydratase
MQGFGRVSPEEDEPVFHEPWEGRVFGIVRSAAVPNLFSRFAIESIEPARYLSSSYYERWMMMLESRLLDDGIVTAEELDAKTERFRQHPDASPSRHEDPALVRSWKERLRSAGSPHREVGVLPQFDVGDPVATRNINPTGHTRLPQCARAKHGVVARCHGVHDSVRFDATELWGEAAEANQVVYIDMWESYLMPASVAS